MVFVSLQKDDTDQVMHFIDAITVLCYKPLHRDWSDKRSYDSRK
jgi:hypothetical protein